MLLFNVRLGKSRDYLKLACVLHVFAAIVIINSSWSIIVVMMGLMVLMFSIGPIFISQRPLPEIAGLSYHGHQWLLGDNKNQETRYDEAYIRFDAGLFLLLSLANAHTKKTLVVFYDQLTTEQRRVLHILGKIKQKKR